MTKEEIEKLEDELEDKILYPISIDELNEDYSLKYGKGYVIDIWFNDIFGWAYSHCMGFIPQRNDTVENIVEEFNKWWELDGIKFRERFNKVEYPSEEKGTYTQEHIDEYFRLNTIIGMDLEKSINEYCQREINDDFL